MYKYNNNSPYSYYDDDEDYPIIRPRHSSSTNLSKGTKIAIGIVFAILLLIIIFFCVISQNGNCGDILFGRRGILK